MAKETSAQVGLQQHCMAYMRGGALLILRSEGSTCRGSTCRNAVIGRAPMTPKMYVGPISHNNSNNMTFVGL